MERKGLTSALVQTAIRIAVVVVVVLMVVLLILYGISRMFDVTFLGLLKALALPITVGAAVPWLNWLQQKRELDIEHERSQDEALQAYLKEIGELLSAKDRPLRRLLLTAGAPDEEREGEAEARVLARALTLTVLARLDGNRKGSVVQYLYESDLIRGADVLDLKGADLRYADLRYADLGYADLSGADLRYADLSGSYLRKATLNNADLSGVNLRRANLYKANLRAYADELYVHEEDQDDEERDPRLTSLRNADLSGARLRKAFLDGVDLTGAKGVTAEDLYRRTSYLEGATMPNGRKYEEWKKSRGEENNGSS